jgi:hypothetical protein
MSEKEGLRNSDKVIVEELYQAVLDSIFNPILPKLRKGISKEEIADLIQPWKPAFPWAESDTRISRLKQMYGESPQDVFEGSDICENDGLPTRSFKARILERVEKLFLKQK